MIASKFQRKRMQKSLENPMVKHVSGENCGTLILDILSFFVQEGQA